MRLARELARAIGDSTPIAVTFRMQGLVSSESAEIGPQQREAIVGAAREALRNVQRHAGVGLAEVLIQCRRDSVLIEVRDRGRGLQGAIAGFGTRTSILARMTDIGGAARIEDAEPGVRVTLECPEQMAAQSESLEVAYEKTVAAAGSGIFLAVSAPMFLMHSYEAARYIAEDRQPVLSTAVYLLAALSYLVTAWWVAHRAPTPEFLLGIGLVQAGLVGLGLYAAGYGSEADLRSWICGFASVPLTICAFVAPARWLPWLVLAPGVTAAIWLGLDPSLPFAKGVGIISGATISTLLACPLGVRVRHTESELRHQRERRLRSWAEMSQQRHLEEAHREYLEFTAEVVAPWLSRIADGSLDPSSAAVADRARKLAMEVRDDLYAGGFLDTDLRAQVRDVRAGGGRVELRPGLRSSHRTDVLTVALERIFSLPERHRVTISPPSGVAALEVVVVPGLSSEQSAPLLAEGLAVGGDEFVTTIACE